jgi:nicotinamide-nucleotide amidase
MRAPGPRKVQLRGGWTGTCPSLPPPLTCCTVVVSATDLKTALAAGVPADLLAARGPVSAETAAALARACALAPGHRGGLLTGVAGPEPVDGHGPGRVYVGTSDAGRTEVLELDLAGDRAAVRAGAVSAAVAGLLARLR